jgi:hypothetical protein
MSTQSRTARLRDVLRRLATQIGEAARAAHRAHVPF